MPGSPGIAKPDIIACPCQQKCRRELSVIGPVVSSTKEAMLQDHHWLWLATVLYFSCRVIDPKHLEPVAILRDHNMTLTLKPITLAHLPKILQVILILPLLPPLLQFLFQPTLLICITSATKPNFSKDPRIPKLPLDGTPLARLPIPTPQAANCHLSAAVLAQPLSAQAHKHLIGPFP